MFNFMAVLVCALLVGGTILSAQYVGNLFYDLFGHPWTYLGAFIGFAAPIATGVVYIRHRINTLRKKFEYYRSSNNLQFDILEHTQRSGFALDLKNELFIFYPSNQAFKQITFDDFQSVSIRDNEMIFQVKDIESPLIQIGVPKPKMAMARLRAAEIIN